MEKQNKVSATFRAVKYKQNERSFVPTDPELVEILKNLVNELKPKQGEKLKLTLERVKG